MSTTYEPGQVAVATVRGVSNVRVMRSSQHPDAPWVSDRGIGAWGVWHRDSDVTDVRPLVVLDFGGLDGIDVVDFIGSLRNGLGGDDAELIADQIEQQVLKPEPRFALGAHVRYAGTSFTSSDDIWGKRRDEKRLGVVVENDLDGDVRVYDTVEHDWWQCDERHLVSFEDGAR